MNPVLNKTAKRLAITMQGVRTSFNAPSTENYVTKATPQLREQLLRGTTGNLWKSIN
jgi:hypothetical protein